MQVLYVSPYSRYSKKIVGIKDLTISEDLCQSGEEINVNSNKSCGKSDLQQLFLTCGCSVSPYLRYLKKIVDLTISEDSKA